MELCFHDGILTKNGLPVFNKYRVTGRALGVPMPLHEELYASLAGKAS